LKTIEIIYKFAELFYSYATIWSHTYGASCTENISRLFPSVLFLVQNHWGNPIVSTYSMEATTLTVSPFSRE
jgi:hypothetical protein